MADEDKGAYDANGDMLAERGQRFRQVAWQINGGPRDGEVLTNSQMNLEDTDFPHGSLSPLYVEVGRD